MRHIRFLLITVMVLAIASTAFAQDDTPLMGAWDACETPSELPDTVTIGLVASITGPISFYGAPQEDGVLMAIDEINASGYLGNTTLAVSIEDSASDPTYNEAISAMAKLIEEDEVTAILGPTLSSEAFAAAPVAQENGVPILGLSNAAENLPQTIGEYYFRALMPESTMIPYTVESAIDLTGMQTVGVLYGDDDDFTLSGYDAFIDALLDNDIDIVSEETFERGDIDFNAQLTNMLGTNPDAIVLAALAAEAVPIIVQARALGFDGPILGGNGLNAPGIVDGAQDAANNVIAGTSYHPSSEDPISAAFTTNFVERFGYEPDQFAAHAYTGAWVMATALRCADSADRDAVRDALVTVENFDSPLGAFGFDENRDPVYSRILQEIQDGEFVVVAEES
ncbi:MAG: ABC transporter substrate-binding protein [Chloroflexota bacterium]